MKSDRHCDVKLASVRKDLQVQILHSALSDPADGVFLFYEIKLSKDEMLKVAEPAQTNLEMVFEWIILSLSIIFIFLGFGGLIIIITNGYKSDILLEYAYAFVYSYMLVLGIILLIYRKKILVKK